METDKAPAVIVEEQGFRQIGDSGLLEKMVKEVLETHVDAVNDYRNGKKQAAGFLVGRIMQKSKGKANPKLVRQMIEDRLNA